MSDAAGISRIWVALDALEHSEAPLGAALGLARAMQAELAALFVENVDLFRMAAFPQSFETRLFGPPRDAQGPQALEAALRAQASALQRQLVRAAGASGVPWSFHTARGRILQQALALAGAEDCVVLPGAAIATSLVIARPGARSSGRSVVPPPGTRQVWALPGAGARGCRALAIAHRILGGGQAGRLVLPEDPQAADELRGWLRQHGWQDEWREASVAELRAARQRPGGAEAGLLLVPRPADVAERAQLEGSLRRFGWPIVMV